MRAVPIAAMTAATVTLGLTLSAAAQMFGPGMPMPGQAPPQQQQQAPPCMKDFMPIRAETEKRANAIKAAMEKKLPREEICGLFKQFTAAESKMVKFILANSEWCGIPPEAGQTMKVNHSRSMRTQKQICEGGGVAGGVQKPTGPGLSEALGTNRPLGGTDPTAPQSGTMNTLSGSVLSR